MLIKTNDGRVFSVSCSAEGIFRFQFKSLEEIGVESVMTVADEQARHIPRENCFQDLFALLDYCENSLYEVNHLILEATERKHFGRVLSEEERREKFESKTYPALVQV